MGASQKIAEFVIDTSYEKIPQEAIDLAKDAILDGIGVSLAGSRDPGGKIITNYVYQLKSNPESGVIAGGFRTSTPGLWGHSHIPPVVRPIDVSELSSTLSKRTVSVQEMWRKCSLVPATESPGY